MGYFFHFTSFLGKNKFYLTYQLSCHKAAHFSFDQIAAKSSFFQLFIVLGMYNFAYYLVLKNTCPVVNKLASFLVPVEKEGPSSFTSFSFLDLI